MKRMILIPILLLGLTGCEERRPLKVSTTNGFIVQKIFQYENCSMYSVVIDRTIYWVNCTGSRSQAVQYNCGKNCIDNNIISARE